MEYVGQTAAVGNAPWWSGAGYGFGRPFADDASNAVRINAAERASAAGFENLLDQNQFAATNNNISQCCNRVTDNQVNGEFRTGDRLRDIEREMNANARIAAQCCCDLKLQMCEDKSELKADILAVESRTIERELNAAQARITQLETIQAITQACGCCPTPSTMSK